MTATVSRSPVFVLPAGSQVSVLARAAWRQARTKIGLLLVGLVVGVALVGPLFAPHSPTAFVAAPYAHLPGRVGFGADYLGRDVLSRFLWGGRSILAIAGLSTAIGLVLGVSAGLLAAYARSILDDVVMRAMDAILAFPSIVLGLVLVATIGPELWLLVLAVALTTAPRVARITRGAAAELVEADFVQASEAFGESRARMLFDQILPNVASPLLVEASLRLTYSIGLIAALGFLGFGRQPPAADWGLMINENRQGLLIQPWGALLPVIAIALLTIGASLVTDGLTRALTGIERGGREL